MRLNVSSPLPWTDVRPSRSRTDVRRTWPDVRLPLLALLVLLLVPGARAQTDGLLQLEDPLHRFLLRQQTGGRLPEAFLSHQPLSAYEARRYLDSLDVRSAGLSALDRRLLAEFRGERAGPNAAWLQRRIPFVYRDGQHLLSARGDGFAVEVDPLLYLTYGRARQTERDEQAGSRTLWQNTRGVRAAGHVGRYVFFEARLEENQRRDVWLDYGQETAPRLGAVQLLPESEAYDYWVGTGVVGVRSRFFEVRFGRDRNRWGFGRTSLALSDYAPVYDQLQIRTTFWRLQYVNLFAALTDLTPFPATSIRDQIYPKKYAAFHRLAVNLPGRVQLELFETIVFATDTTAARRRSNFDLAYLNPIIFYTAAQADRGHADNALLGGGLAWTARPGLRLYTQLLLDELTVGEIGRASWVNKWGWQVGARVADVLAPGLSFQVEYARLRPYLYSHRSALTSYTHFNDLLGHPAGPNAQDVALFVDWQATPRWRAALNLAYTRRGRNADSLNYGADPLESYDTRVSDDDVRLLQGVRQSRLLVEAHTGYELLPGLTLEAALRAESVDDAETGLDRYLAPFVMLRWGLPFQSRRY